MVKVMIAAVIPVVAAVKTPNPITAQISGKALSMTVHAAKRL
ncbi:MAG: hypothetical protein ACI4QB_07910 [Eubacteriales bacterium]